MCGTFSVYLVDRHRFTDLLIWKEANQIKMDLYGSMIPDEFHKKGMLILSIKHIVQFMEISEDNFK